MFKLIATDLDHTLLNLDGLVPEGTKEYIRKAVERGMFFAISTGRSIKSAQGVADSIGAAYMAICYNGALVIDTVNNVTIEEGCWIGSRVTILPRVKRGKKSIIGANSVVSKDIPPYSICVGNPCIVKKYRFDNEMIQLLEELKWWDKPIEDIKELIPLLSNSDLDYVKKEITNMGYAKPSKGTQIG